VGEDRNVRGRIATIVIALSISSSAHAGKHPRFEPTDLELEDSGTVEVDLQAGPVRGPDANRIVGADFEIDFGILPYLELDLDGAYGIEGVPRGSPGPTFLDHSAPENLWLSVKLGLWDHRDPITNNAWAIGVQLGPKFPIATDTHGIGFESLALIGRMMGPVHLVGQIGGLVDPHEGTSPRPFGIEGGLDLDLDLTKDTWSLLGELGGIWYGSADASQLSATLGIQWSPSQKLDLSIVAMVGFLSGSDPVGLLFGASPKFSLW
jgi:hypothetical protein